MVSVSIIIPCRNEIRALPGFLDSLTSQDRTDLEWEVLVADGMSNDGSREILSAFEKNHKWFRVVDNPKQIVSTGLNLAIGEAIGEIILRMDVHTRYAPDYVRQCVEVLQESGADNVGGPAQTKATGFLANAIAAAYHSRFSCGGARFHQPDYEGWVDTIPYGCWRRSKLLEIGLFDETLVRNQDDELNLRLIRSGGRIWQSPQIVSWYSPRTTLAALFRQYFQYGFWKVAVIRKHRLPASWRHLVPGIFVLTLIGLSLVTIGEMIWKPGMPVSILAMLAVISTYGVASGIAAVSAIRGRDWRYALLLPIIFLNYHCGYGLGFLAGVINNVTPRTQKNPSWKRVTELTR